MILKNDDDLKKLSMEELKMCLIAMKGYITGCIDTFDIINNIGDRTVKFYEEKISLCEKEIASRN